MHFFHSYICSFFCDNSVSPPPILYENVCLRIPTCSTCNPLLVSALILAPCSDRQHMQDQDAGSQVQDENKTVKILSRDQDNVSRLPSQVSCADNDVVIVCRKWNIKENDTTRFECHNHLNNAALSL